MGYRLHKESFDAVLEELGKSYRLYAPVRKIGEGRFTDTDIIRYDFVESVEEMELEQKSDYSFKEFLTPLSQTLFYFTEEVMTEAGIAAEETILFLRSCDVHSLKRLDDIYLNNKFEDPFYKKIREHMHFALIGCSHPFEECFCIDMHSSRTTEGYLFSLDINGDTVYSDVKDETVAALFRRVGAVEQEVEPNYVIENPVHVTVPEVISNEIYAAPMWEEYTRRCINCGRCTTVCPTCTCFTMQDTFYSENGKVGERRRVAGSCMLNGYTTVAGGGEYRRENGDRMRFKVLHKIYDHRRRFGYDMCVGCGRCTTVCPEYISFPNIINKVNRAVTEELK